MHFQVKTVNGKRRVSWDGVKGGKQAGKWVARESIDAQIKSVGLGPCNQKTHTTLGKTMGLLGTKTSNLGLGWSSPRNLETGQSSLSGPSVLETSNQNCFSIPSSGRSELTTTKNLESSMVLPTTEVQLCSVAEGDLSHDLSYSTDGSGR
nr:hypothetical protein CFP56_06684 [Quercus suber]